MPLHCETALRRVLIIEDNPDSAETMKYLLELNGHTVVVAYTGHEGIAKARQLKPDVILCDIGLPDGLDGYDVVRALRREHALQGAAMIALTGYGRLEDKRRAAEAGFHTHLTKPIDPAQLEELVARLPGIHS